MIHPTCLIAPSAVVPPDTEAGPYCVIGDHVTLGPGCRLMSHVVLQGPSTFGAGNLFHPFCSIGGKTQDLKYTGEPTLLEVGDRNEFREYVTVNRGTAIGEKTIIGHDNLFLTYAHVAHNCIVGNHCIFSNNGTLAGHVTVEDYAIISGLAAVHQFCRVGRHSIVGGCSKIVQDVPPYCVADGNPAEVRAINQVGLQRRGYPDETITALRKALRLLYDKTLNTSQAMQKIEDQLGSVTEVRHMVDFVRTTKRGIIR
ncbi:MAG: acyl-ACP--UDP-N-acetylglucosamine O-acyltransferase [Candidatus Methylacidiphilales bacterium]|nr:acyl-ACP--UDP-N-acetylglucosamine O-acyltransferase [Candidatus Methylacidiphilales bacterium]